MSVEVDTSVVVAAISGAMFELHGKPEYAGLLEKLSAAMGQLVEGVGFKAMESGTDRLVDGLRAECDRLRARLLEHRSDPTGSGIPAEITSVRRDGRAGGSRVATVQLTVLLGDTAGMVAPCEAMLVFAPAATDIEAS